MKERLILLSSWLVPACFAVLTSVALLVPMAASATPMPYVLKLTQRGNSVVATGAGAFDLSGLQLRPNGHLFTIVYPAWMEPAEASFELGSTTNVADVYVGVFSGPTSFGSGSDSIGSSGTGDPIAFGPDLFVPTGYTSGTMLANTAVWEHATFASLGVAPGTYVWSWGTGAEQRLTLVATVPEPTGWGMFGFGALLIGVLGILRRRIA